MEMFERAVREKYRFQSSKGVLSVEDLWDLSLEKLNALYQNLNREVKSLAEDSLFQENIEQHQVADRRNLVAYIFGRKQYEQRERTAQAENSAKKQKLMSYLAQKQDEQYMEMSVDELTALIDSL